MWDQLHDIALLGTERRQIDTASLPEEIAALVTQSPSTNQETLFLESLAFYHLYRESGKKTQHFNGELPAEIMEDSRVMAPEELVHLFSAIQGLESPLKENLFKQWLSVLIKKDYIIPSTYIIPLVKFSQNHSQSIRQDVKQVIGKKGQDILPYLKDFSVKEEKESGILWNEGTTDERKKLLTGLVENDPEKALSLIQSTWKQESIAVKSAFLKILTDNPASIFIDFMEECYNTEFSFKQKEKKTEKQCRQLCAAFLIQSQGTKLCEETTEQVLRYIKVSSAKSILGIKSAKQQVFIDIPLDGDNEFWNASLMNEKYGFETDNYDIALFSKDSLYWLSCILEITPFDILTQRLGITIDQLCDSLLSEDKFKTKVKGKVIPIFYPAILRNANNTKNQELIYYIINSRGENQVLHLLRYLSCENYETFVQNAKLSGSMEILANCPHDSQNKIWSLPFSNHVLSSTYDSFMDKGYYSHYNTGKIIGGFIHLNAEQLLNHIQDELIKKTKREELTSNLNSSILNIAAKVLQVTPANQGNSQTPSQNKQNIADFWDKYIHQPVSKAIYIRNTIQMEEERKWED